jgi:hypothetical protein
MQLVLGRLMRRTEVRGQHAEDRPVAIDQRRRLHRPHTRRAHDRLKPGIVEGGVRLDVLDDHPRALAHRSAACRLAGVGSTEVVEKDGLEALLRHDLKGAREWVYQLNIPEIGAGGADRCVEDMGQEYPAFS